MREFELKLKMINTNGTSFYGENLNDILRLNRVGEGKKRLTQQQILEKFVPKEEG